MNIRARIRQLVAERAALVAKTNSRPPLEGIARAARIALLVNVADPLAPMTTLNRRACRVATLMYQAQERATRAPH